VVAYQAADPGIETAFDDAVLAQVARIPGLPQQGYLRDLGHERLAGLAAYPPGCVVRGGTPRRNEIVSARDASASSEALPAPSDQRGWPHLGRDGMAGRH
jgi:hypothetical protein